MGSNWSYPHFVLFGENQNCKTLCLTKSWCCEGNYWEAGKLGWVKSEPTEWTSLWLGIYTIPKSWQTATTDEQTVQPLSTFHSPASTWRLKIKSCLISLPQHCSLAVTGISHHSRFPGHGPLSHSGVPGCLGPLEQRMLSVQSKYHCTIHSPLWLSLLVSSRWSAL